MRCNKCHKEICERCFGSLEPKHCPFCRNSFSRTPYPREPAEAWSDEETERRPFPRAPRNWHIQLQPTTTKPVLSGEFSVQEREQYNIQRCTNYRCLLCYTEVSNIKKCFECNRGICINCFQRYRYRCEFCMSTNVERPFHLIL